MNKILCVSALMLLLGSVVLGQSLEKGNLIGTHVLTFKSNPGVTMDHWKEFMLDKWIPGIEKHYEGFELYLIKGVRGEDGNSLGLIWVIESEKQRDRYYDDDGEYTEAGLVVQEKLKPLIKESEKLGTFTYTYTDWIVL